MAARVVSRGDGRREEFGWGRIEWLANHELTPGAELTLGHVVLQPDKSNPRHYHPNCHELLYVLEGAIEHDLGGETVKLCDGISAAHPAWGPAPGAERWRGSGRAFGDLFQRDARDRLHRYRSCLTGR